MENIISGFLVIRNSSNKRHIGTTALIWGQHLILTFFVPNVVLIRWQRLFWAALTLVNTVNLNQSLKGYIYHSNKLGRVLQEFIKNTTISSPKNKNCFVLEVFSSTSCYCLCINKVTFCKISRQEFAHSHVNIEVLECPAIHCCQGRFHSLFYFRAFKRLELTSL